ncbi:MAG TPA: amidohydrolase family protein [Burkholderiales bacterium]|jgi:predicted TIM-barrel fold metal-dependent hydrolase|nr:amidohydrolase family protein [Burkholderiales bacterium]
MERKPDIPPPVADTHAPREKFPPKATDCHAHVFGPETPLLPKTHFVPHPCPLADYVRMLRKLGCERAVLVQPSVYGTDNGMIAAALRSKVFPLRAVAVVAHDVSDRELEDMHAEGFRGVRINTASATKGLKLEHAARLAERLRPMGWHLQFFVNLRQTPQIEEQLAKLKITIVIDHFARIGAADGLDAPPFQALLRLLRRDNCWAKVMGPYFASEQFPRYPDLAPFARAMVAAAPDRIVWGTDWPHASAREKMQNDGDYADMLIDWVPDAAQRRAILVTNPERLYSFQ